MPLTKNGKLVAAGSLALRLGSHATNNNQYCRETGGLVDTTGTVQNYLYYQPYAGYSLFPSFQIGGTPNTNRLDLPFTGLVAIGNGTAAFSVDDYELNNQIASQWLLYDQTWESQLSNSMVAAGPLSISFEDGEAVAQILVKGKNTGESPISISEIGIFGHGAFGSSMNDGNIGNGYRDILLIREVFEPFEVPSGGAWERVIKITI